ncbi:MAG: TlpA disulfide reductase family protein, partial [Myxococcota bacterium]
QKPDGAFMEAQAPPLAALKASPMPAILLRVLWAPKLAFDAVIARGGGFNWLFAILALELFLEQPETAGVLGMRLTDAPVSVLSTFVRYAVGPAFFVFLAGVLAHSLTRSRTQDMDIESWAALFTVAWVPHTVWLSLSVLAERAGFDSILLPHHSARSQLLHGEGYQYLGLFIELAPVLLFGAWAITHTLRRENGHSGGHSRWRIPALALSAFLVAAALVSNASYVRAHWEEIRPVGTGDTLPAMVLGGLDGDALATESLRGRVVLVDFWATWCGPCRQTLPTLQRLHDELGDDFVLLSVNVEPEDREGVRAFMTENDLRFPVYVDNGELQRRMHVDTLPTAFIVDRGGVVRDMHVGSWGLSALRGTVEALLADGR